MKVNYSKLFEKLKRENITQKAFRKDNKPKYIQAHDFLFTGMVKCAHCGCIISGEIKKGKYIYYSCSDKTKGCLNNKIYVRQEVIEKVFEQAIKNVNINVNKVLGQK